MNHVFVRVKGLRKKPFFKLLSNCMLFPAVEVDVGSCVPYSPDHNLDEDSWFKIENFSNQPYCVGYVNNFDSKDYDDLSGDKFSKIAYIFSSQGNNFYFQKITPSLFVNKKFIAFGEIAEVEDNKNRLVVNGQPDAVYLKDSDVLIFKNLATISSIFEGVDVLFKEATHEEVRSFLSEPFISLGAGYGVDSVSKPNRKRIALAMEALNEMSEEDRHGMIGYINEYANGRLNFDASNNKFEVSKDEELKTLIYGVEQRFYTTPFGKEKRLANSVQLAN